MQHRLSGLVTVNRLFDDSMHKRVSFGESALYIFNFLIFFALGLE